MAETVRIEIPIETIDNTESGLKSAENGLKRVDSAAKQTKSSVKSAEETVSKFDRRSQKTEKTLSNWMKQKYELVLEAKEKISPILSKIGTGLKSITKRAWNVTVKAIDKVTSPIRGIFRLLSNPLLQAGAILGVTIGLKDTIDTYANFEATMSKVKAISGATGEEFQKLTDKAKQMGASTKFTAQESAEAFTYMGMAGWKSKDMLDGIGGIMSLSAADGLDLATTSDIVTDALTAFGLQAKDSTHFADVLAKASTSANTNVSMMGETFKYVAPVAGSLGYSVEDTAVAIGLMANSGIKASQAGTQLRAAMANLAKPTDKQAAMMNKLGLSITKENGDMKSLMEVMKMLREKMKSLSDEEKQASIEALTGISAKQAAKEAMKGLSQEQIKNKTALELGLKAIKKYDVEQLNSALYKQYSKKELKDMTEEQKRNIVAMEQGKIAMEGLSKAEQTKAAATVFGKEAMSGWLAIINSSEEDFKKLTKEIYNADGAADEMAKTMLDNLQGSFKLLQSAVEGVKNQIGEGLAPYLRKFADWLTSKMPDMQKDVADFFESFDKKAESFMQTVNEMMNSDEWNHSDLFGKVHIAWDTLIAEPFSKWWDSTGKALFAEKANDIGKGIGSGLSNMLQVLLGIDLSTTLKEGESVGGAFAKGFVDGFDIQGLKSKFGEAVKGLFSNAASILPGGKEADLSSWFSAALIAKMGIPLVGMGMRGARLGKSIFGNTTIPYPENNGGTIVVPGIGRRLIGGFSIGEELAGTGLAKGTGLLGMLGKTGMALGSGATSSAGLVLAGGGAVAGGLASGATAISAGKDLYKSFKTDDKREAGVLRESAAWKGGGVVGGAITGATIASVIPIPVISQAIGGLIGAGVGGIAGWIKGDSVKKNYEKEVEEAHAAKEALKRIKEQEKYESEDLKKALLDDSVTNLEFAQMFQAKVEENYRRRFGDIKLSMQEVGELADKIVFDKQIKTVNQFEEATARAKDSTLNLQESMSTMQRLNWKAGIGVKLTDTEIEEYKMGIAEMVKSSKSLIEDKHYEAKMSFDLLVDKKTSKKMNSSLNKLYNGMQEEIDGLSKKLDKKMNIALEDGILTIDEEKEITNLQEQIANITDRINGNIMQSKTDAKFTALKIKYSGAELDADSFTDLQTELQKQIAALNQNYDESLEISISNLNLELAEKAITKTEYKDQLDDIIEGYKANIKELQVRVQDFQLEAIAESYSDKLDGILPEIKGTTVEKLKKALKEAIETGDDLTLWDSDNIIEWFGLKEIDRESQQKVAELMGQLFKTLPEIDYSLISSSFSENISESVLDGLNNIKLPEGPNLGTTICESITESLEGVDLLTTFSSVDMKLREGAKRTNFASVATNIGVGVGSAITGMDMSPILSAIKSLKDNTGASINSAFAAGFHTNTSVRIHPTYTIDSASPKFNFSVGGKPAKNANGNIIRSPLLSWVGEDGPEAIIPLGSKRRSRGLSLWEQAGEMLGVRKYAEEGIIHTPNEMNPMTESPMYDYLSNATYDAISNEDESVGAIITNTDEKKEVSNQFDIQINVNPVFEINGGSDDSKILNIIKSCVPNIADDIAGEIAEKLQGHFSNMPLREA